MNSTKNLPIWVMLGLVDGSDESNPSTTNPEYQTLKSFKIFYD